MMVCFDAYYDCHVPLRVYALARVSAAVITISGDVPVPAPEWTDGLDVCKPGTISSVDFAEFECFSWTLLQGPPSTSCTAFIDVPTGWTWAPDDAQTQRGALLSWCSTLQLMHAHLILDDAVIASVGSTKWADNLGAGGCIAVGNPASPKGYTVTGSACDTSQIIVKPFGQDKPQCYRISCGSRILLKVRWFSIINEFTRANI
jgi:hypothetical protein